MIKGWKYYNHAVVPSSAPHEKVDLEPIINGSIWQGFDNKYPLLARWITDWDCEEKTNWWYCIRDGVYSLDELDKSSRKHIRQAMRCNNVKHCKLNYNLIDSMYIIYKESTALYLKADNVLSREDFFNEMTDSCGIWDVFLAYDFDDKLMAYITLIDHVEWVEILSAKFGVNARKKQSSTALYNSILDYYLNNRKVKYVSSGSRSINHETGTQEYKERVFKYRKAYCRLNIKYRPGVNLIVCLLFPFRNLFSKFDSILIIHQINSVLLMEELSRKDKE